MADCSHMPVETQVKLYRRLLDLDYTEGEIQESTGINPALWEAPVVVIKPETFRRYLRALKQEIA